eukprot:gene15697-6990_t
MERHLLKVASMAGTIFRPSRPHIVNAALVILTLGVVTNNCMYDDAFDVGVNVGHHIMRRSLPETNAVPNITYTCNISTLPQPTEDYPAILFKDVNYNNCSKGGFYVKIRAGHYHTWCKNDNLARKRVMRFSSILVLPGHNVTFKACCPSGNEWYKMVDDISSTPDLNHTVFYNSKLSGNKGIWYTTSISNDGMYFEDSQHGNTLGIPSLLLISEILGLKFRFTLLPMKSELTDAFISAHILWALHPCNRRQSFASVLASYGTYTRLNVYVVMPAYEVGGWLHWDTSFFLKVEDHSNGTMLSDSCGNCYFGSCGATGKCECAPGYSGSSCGTRPSNLTYPSQQHPLVLYTETNFAGTATHVKPDEFKVFAANRRYAREIYFKSLRVLFNRTVIFARNVVFPTNFYNGNDIEDIEEFMNANTETANRLWFNYEASIEADFAVKIDGNPRCDNCSSVGGVCYTGFCNCMSGYTGANCETSV